MSLRPLTLAEPTDDNRFNSIDPLDGRYYDAEIAKYLSEKTRVLTQAHIEAALAYGLAEFGICSQEVAEQIDAEVRAIVEGAYIRVRELLSVHIDKLHLVAKALLEQETLNREELEAVFVGV